MLAGLWSAAATAIEPEVDPAGEHQNGPSPAPVREFVPTLSVPWVSTYGTIEWQDGWYGNPNQYLQILERRIDQTQERVVLRGRWGRTQNSNKHGGFEFEFTSACQFIGTWWHSGTDTRIPWTGACMPGITEY